MREEVKSIIANLSTLIHEAMCIVSTEKECPGGDPDLSDDKIKKYSERVNKMRQIREQFEDEMTK